MQARVVLSAREAWFSLVVGNLLLARFRMARSRRSDSTDGSNSRTQRLSIARAFLKNAPILILDEPAAALDTASERHVVAAIDRLRHQRTTFVIAHRLSTVRAADRIIVLDEGTVVAEGTHETLRQDSPLYRELAAQLTDAS